MRKKAQEEMVGFVLIMLVVAVIFLVFLGIFVRQYTSPKKTDSKEIAQFLEAIFDYTTECGPDYSPYKISRLIIECHENGGSLCSTSNPGDVCDVLENTLRDLTEASWNFKENSPNKGYLLFIRRETDAGEAGINVSVFKSTGAPKARRAADKPLPGGIIMHLEISS